MTEELLSLTILPYEVQTMILQYVVTDILNDLRRGNSDISYTVRLRRWLDLRLVCKTFDTILSQMGFEGDSLDALLRRKQLEKLDYALEALRLTCDAPPINRLLSIPKIKFMCGRFWHNPGLSVDSIRAIFSILQDYQCINFAIKLESWILRHATRSEESWQSNDGNLSFERGDWVVDGGGLQIHRVSRVKCIPGTIMGMYLTQEYGHPLGPVHERIGHERRWFLKYRDYVIGRGYRQKIGLVVNYETKMIWDHFEQKVIDFQGQEYRFQAEEDDDDDDDDDEEEEEEERRRGGFRF